MSRFSDILDEVEAICARSNEARGSRFFSAGAVFCLAQSEPPSKPMVISAYLATSDATRRVSEAAFEEECARALLDSRMDVMSLRALRREVAWRLHPDLFPADSRRTQTLARMNAEIDDAISRARQGSRIRPA